jgi:hypothetical protein
MILVLSRGSTKNSTIIDGGHNHQRISDRPKSAAYLYFYGFRSESRTPGTAVGVYLPMILNFRSGLSYEELKVKLERDDYSFRSYFIDTVYRQIPTSEFLPAVTDLKNLWSLSLSLLDRGVR